MHVPFTRFWPPSQKKYRIVGEEDKPLTSFLPVPYLDTSERGCSIQEIHQLQRRSKILCTISAALTILLLLSTALCLRLALAPSFHPAEPKKSCGISVVEAKALGCTFDLLSRSWLPEDCTRFGNDEFLTGLKRFNTTGFGLYADRAGRRALTMEEIMEYAESGLKWYGTERQHLLHCQWLLKRVLDAYINGKKVDVVSQMFLHTGHCVETLHNRTVKADALDEIALRGNVRFGVC